MQQTDEPARGSLLGSVFGVVVRLQTYLNLLYLFIAFPLGLAYFIFLVTGLSVGISLVIIWVGLPILLFMLAAWWVLAIFERQLDDILHPAEAENRLVAGGPPRLASRAGWRGAEPVHGSEVGE